MIVNSKERLETVLEAERQFREARGSVPAEGFYRDKIAQAWGRASGAPAYRDIGDFSWPAFTALPATPKERLKADPWSFVATTLQESAKYYETTGTTGSATPTPRLAEDILWNAVSVAGAWRDPLGDEPRVLSLLPSDIVPVGDLVASVCEYLGVPHARAYPFATGISDWDRLVGLLTAFRPTALFLAPGVALQTTRLLQQRGLLERARASVTTLMLLGEVSVPAMRARLGAWWGARAYDASYGSTETGTLAAACPADGLHLLAAAHYCELADAEGRVTPLRPGASGRLVVTPLNLHARPLLRYDTGDEVTVADGCPCGLATPTLTVHGRAGDAVVIGGAALDPRSVEEVVYGETTATGYVLEVDRAAGRLRVLLERQVGSDRAGEDAVAAAFRGAFARRTGLACDDVVFVNTLPAATKSGGSQKSWKRSNIRFVEPR
ncbi:phenylacetate--CoA ligase family protein [Streptomyces sp. PT12]|uniref:phenylacetate--CoA ligase family protein n=1 Tax=Streptomyces sp. PT12 TaxID=1510197 RepID=UPI000DE34846|nr:phenylacetate--CoA ligase family protein [Streptomyces sp. PT12]RBM19446.1 CoF synthetase [Streptomyces sp. PT12]